MFSRLVQDLKANESRLRDINKVAAELESEGLMAEEAPILQAQVGHLNLETAFHSFIWNLILIIFFSVCSNKSCLVLLLARFECFFFILHTFNFTFNTLQFPTMLCMHYVLFVVQDEADSKTASPWKVSFMSNSSFLSKKCILTLCFVKIPATANI